MGDKAATERRIITMGEINGYKTIALIAVELAELKVGEPKIREAIKELKIEPTIFNVDRRARYYAPADITRIKEWLLTH
jgi:hypothetical protein